MKLCLITPAAHVKMTSFLSGRFCIAPVARENERYKTFFQECAQRGEEVILDNGVFESDLMPDEALIHLAKEINPPVLIVPDVINAPALANYLRAKDFVSFAAPQLHKRTQFMFVLQTEKGKTRDFWRAFEAWLERAPEMTWLGVCRDACRNAFSGYTYTDDQELNRFYFLSELARRGYLPELKKYGKKIHLLGMGSKISLIQYFWFVHSMDTASLFWQAAHFGKVLSATSLDFSEEFLKRPYNYFELDYDILRRSLMIQPENLNWKLAVERNCSIAQQCATKADQFRKTKIFNERI